MIRDLVLNQKTGFKVTDKTVPINIRDYRGILFYSTESLLPYVESFNLPAGEYMIDSGFFSQMSAPVDFTLEPLPKSEVLFPDDPTNFSIEFAPNPNKCTIYWKEKMIVFDDGTATGINFAECPLPEFYFILYHEYGHSRYGFGRLYTPNEVEAYCDLYSSNKMLSQGYNPSQIMAAPKKTLSSKQDYRKDYIETTLLNNA